MTNFAGKLPYVQNLSQSVDYRNEANQQQMGWELPCTVIAISDDGLFVTVNFEMVQNAFQFPQITIPVFMSEYVRLPIQIGTRGYTTFVDVPTEQITAEKSTPATFKNFGNLNKVLVFQPITNKGWPSNPDINVVWMYGPNGVTIQDEAENSVVTITPTGITLKSGTSFISIAKNGAIDIEGTSVKIMGKDFLTHHHSGVSTGSSNTGNVV